MLVGPRRTYIINSILPRVVPSQQGDNRWKLLTTTAQTVGTSCALLPRFVANELGVHSANASDGLLDYGLATMRNAGIKAGAWRHYTPGSDRRPNPGDLYMLCTGGALHASGCNCLVPLPSKPEVLAIRREFNNDAAKIQKALQDRYYRLYTGSKIEHVGVIKSAQGGTWITADAGQGAGQECREVQRTWNAATGMLRGEMDGHGGRPMRFLCGWLDVDNYPFMNH
jgi:hypothetical protein